MLDEQTLLESIRAATEEVFETMLGGAIEFDESAEGDADSGLMAIVGLTGSWSGAGTMACSPHLGNLVASTMFMSEENSDRKQNR